ncbi:MAG: hypothetical protein KAI24_26625 [Planctomycetes bacterium]|nr:hypothetical protein [Planctomycetota bacterium]
MNDDDDFWEALRESADDAEATSRDELAEAERQLREVDEEGDVAPLPRAFVEAVVSRAVAERRGGAQRNGQHDGSDRPDESGEPTNVRSMSSFRRVLAAAAALLVAPKFLLAAGAVTALAVGTMVLRYTTTSLPFQDAVVILMDERQNDAARMAAQGRIYFDVIESIGILLDVGDEPGLASGVRDSLERIRAELRAGQPFARMAYPEPHQELGNRALASDLDPGVRRLAVDQLTDQVVYGIRALNAIAAGGGPAELLTQNEAQLQRIRQLAGE